jgi:hypothetical protein
MCRCSGLSKLFNNLRNKKWLSLFIVYGITLVIIFISLSNLVAYTVNTKPILTMEDIKISQYIEKYSFEYNLTDYNITVIAPNIKAYWISSAFLHMNRDYAVNEYLLKKDHIFIDWLNNKNSSYLVAALTDITCESVAEKNVTTWLERKEGNIELVHKEGNMVFLKKKLVDLENFSLDSKSKVFCKGGNWHGLESLQDIPSSWISNNASILIFAPENSNSSLSFNTLSFYKPRMQQIYLNDKLIYEQNIKTIFTEVKIPIKLKKGENVLRFYTPEGCQRPIEIPELNNMDRRCLSLAFQNITLT